MEISKLIKELFDKNLKKKEIWDQIQTSLNISENEFLDICDLLSEKNLLPDSYYKNLTDDEVVKIHERMQEKTPWMNDIIDFSEFGIEFEEENDNDQI